MKKICSRCCVILGTILIISALSLVLYNMNENNKSGEVSEAVLNDIKIKISEQSKTVETTEITENYKFIEPYVQETTTLKEEHFIEIDGNSYIGFIAIPSLSIELPVMSQWSYDNLKISPCRYQGSISENNLIIAAHNYSRHFGEINKLYSNDEIIFTDADGVSYTYKVVHTEMIDGMAVSEMVENTDNNWDLTIFTCNLSGQSRVTVRAVRFSD